MRIILLVETFPIPTALEMDLSPKSILTVRLPHKRCFFTRRFIQTRERYSIRNRATVFECLGIFFVRARGYVAGDHAEAGGEGFYVCFVVAAAEVVDYHAAVGNFLEGAVGVLVVEEGGPVGGFVVLDFAGGAVCGAEGVVG